MKFTDFLRLKDVRDQLKPLRPRLSRQIPETIKALPNSNRHALVGTAIDYLLRFEIRRRCPYAKTREFIAENAVKMFVSMIEHEVIKPIVMDNKGEVVESDPTVICRNACTVMEQDKKDIYKFFSNSAPCSADLCHVCTIAIRFAKLDAFFRAGILEPDNVDLDQKDVQDLLNLYTIAPFEVLTNPGSVYLNPMFGGPRLVFGDADADLISGDFLIDFKSTKKSDIEARHLDQLLGYLLLARRWREFDKSFPRIGYLGLYFCRHAYLLKIPAENWTEHPEFPDLESWFFQRALAI